MRDARNDRETCPGATLVVVGGIGIDLLVRLPRLPGPNDRLSPTETLLAPGGMGGNVAAAYARLGGAVRFLGGFVRDDDGATLRAGLTALGVDLSFAPDLGLPCTPRGLILVDANGERAIIGGWSQIMAANMAMLTANPVPAAIAPVRAARWSLNPETLASPTGPFALPGTICYCQGVLAPSVLPHVPAAVPICMDVEREHLSTLTSGVVRQLLARVEILFGNTESLTEVAGQLGLERAEEIAPLVRRAVVITRGAAGCTVAGREQPPLDIPGYPVHPCDTTGAGDCFAAAFLYALTHAESLMRAARFANVAAALSTSALGARGALPTVADVTRHDATVQL